MTCFDAAIIGAGAAGMMAAAVAGQRGQRVLLIDHASKLAEKIRISGGGRCNFTNRHTQPENFLSQNPHFCRSALARYTPQDFMALLRRHGIGFHEKHKGQLFCDESSEHIINMLRAECDAGQVQWRMPCTVQRVRRDAEHFVLETEAGEIKARRVVIATGGLSIPKIGASDFGLRLARQFGLKVIDPQPALVPLTFASDAWQPFAALAGLALEVEVRSGAGCFVEDLLFTHRGLSGPAILQISSYWQGGTPLQIDLAPGEALAERWHARTHSKQVMANWLAEFFSRRFADTWLTVQGLPADKKVAELSDKTGQSLLQSLRTWQLRPSGTEGWRKAEVMRGGVSTAELSQTTLEAKRVPGLHFVGEVVDVTGWLGGYNFQWAWASGVACGLAI